MAPRRRFDKLPETTRKAILDAAADEFAKEGFERASINKIVAATDLSKGALYYYFEDKEDLYAAVMDAVMDRAVEVVGDLPEPTDAESFWKMIWVGMDRLNAEFTHDARLAALGRTLYARGGADPTYLRLMERSRGWVRHVIELGQRVGAVRSDLPIALLAESATGMLIAMDRWFVMAMERTPTDQLIAMIPKSLEMIRDFISPRSSGKPNGGDPS